MQGRRDQRGIRWRSRREEQWEREGSLQGAEERRGGEEQRELEEGWREMEGEEGGSAVQEC